MLLKNKPAKFLVKRLATNFSFQYYKHKLYIPKYEALTKDELRDYQFKKIKKIISYSYTHIPYYHNLFTQINFKPSDFKSLEDIKLLPFLDKDIYRANYDSMVSNKYIKKLLPTVFTGGTTGAPLQLIRNYGDYGRERAYTEFAYKMAGMDHRVKTVYMRGKVADEKGIYHTVSDFGKTLYLSSHKMTGDILDNYLELIAGFKPILFYTLPSVGTVFAEHIIRKGGVNFDSLKWIFCPSENLYDFQAKAMQEAFNCKIGSFYGHAEHAILATKCKHSDLYHMLPHYGYCELIDEKGNPVKKPGIIGELVGTSFTNPASPLIRYRTGDYAALAENSCSCGRNSLLLENLQGREQSVAVDKNRSRINIGPELLCTIRDKSYQKMKQFRLEQNIIGELCVYIEPVEDASFTEISEGFKTFFEKLYPGMFDISVSQLKKKDEEKTSDKHLYFVQNLDLEHLND